MTIVNFETYVSLEVAKLLRKAGFNWIGKYSYIITPVGDMPTGEEGMFIESNRDTNWLVKAPTLAIVQRWLREVKSFEICVGFTKHDFGNGNEKAYFYSCYEVPENEDAHEYFEDKYYHSYEEAQEAGIKKALEIILEKGE